MDRSPDLPRTDPPSADPAALGERLRTLRTRSGMSLRALARALDISPSAVSQIERGQLQPSVNRIIAIANALDVPLALVFETAEQHDDRVSTDSELGHDYVLARQGQVPPVHLEGGVIFRSLSPVSTPRVQLFESTYPPGSRGSVHGDLIRHVGFEVGRVTQGELTIEFATERVVLGVGDSITFPCTVPHLLLNDSATTTVATWLIADPER